MTDKVQKIKEWISKTQDGLMNANGNFGYLEHEGVYHILCNLDAYIDSLQEEPVSEDLEVVAQEHATKEGYLAGLHYNSMVRSFITGAIWQKEQMMKDAIPATVFCESLKIPTIGHFLHKTNLKEGDKVKVIIIKSE